MNSTLFILLSLTFTALAQATTFDAVIRADSGKAVIRPVELSDLVSSTAFEGKYFVLVKGKEKEAIKFDSDKELLLRAATVYFHLTKARNYFVDKVGSSYAKSLKPLKIRIEHTNQFSELGHFAHDNYEPQYNNALTVPAGKGLESKGIKPWGMEIWFRPKKRVHINDIPVNNLGSQEVKSMLSSFRNQIHMQSLQRFMAQVVTSFTVENMPISPLSIDNVMRTAGSSLIMEMGYRFIDPLSKFTSRKWFWLDTALVPEIIYHEYAHIALSDHLVLSHSTAIIEGMADFFAGQIADSPKLAKNIKKYNTYNGKNAKRKREYMLQFEMSDYANTDFVFGLLWELKNMLGEEKGERFMFDLRKNLSTNSSIRSGLVDGVLKTCDTNCDQPFVDKINIQKAFRLKGI